MYRLFILAFLALCALPAFSNNIRISDDAKVVGFTGASNDTAIVELKLTWENSWYDDYNWDAAWVFLKYRRRGSGEKWYHGVLGRGGHESETANIGFDTGDTGGRTVGVFVRRTRSYAGNENITLRLKLALRGNPSSGASLSKADFGDDLSGVYVMGYAIEMVYVPTGAYYLGDGYSSGSFGKSVIGGLPSVYDLIGSDVSFVYSASGGTASNAADRRDNSTSSATAWSPGASGWWQVDFREARKIRYFGVSGLSNALTSRPRTVWYLEGSNNQSDWSVLWSGPSVFWSTGVTSYPVQRAIRVPNPQSFRYYRVRTTDAENGSACWAANIAMTEDELYADQVSSYLVESENALTLGENLYASDSHLWTGSIASAYPKGYSGFYCMKYELSQEQYVDFLNTLTLEQQKRRVENSNFGGMERGDYVFGDLKRADNRNGIAVLPAADSESPAVFVNELTADGKYYGSDDGQTLPCNYLSPADMLAYSDWSGLRPMSELEYEKAGRRLYPSRPEKGEYVWNTNTSVNKLVLGLPNLKYPGTEQESPNNDKINVNIGGTVDGPVRCGSFANSRTDQMYSGSTTWGVMEMSGNLWELCYNAGTEGRNFRTDNAAYACGDGTLGSNGESDIPDAYWNKNASAFGVRGGSYADGEDALCVSSRSSSSGNFFPSFTSRMSTVGFRCVRGFTSVGTLSGGRIYCSNGQLRDTVCYGDGYRIGGDDASGGTGKLSYLWYVSEDNGSSWKLVEGYTGTSLSYTSFDNQTTSLKSYQFRRKVICALGEAYSSVVTIVVSNRVTVVPSLLANLYPTLGYGYSLPESTLSGYRYKWTFPDYREVVGSYTFASYGTGNNGTYYVSYVNGVGCAGDKKGVEILGREPIRIANKGGYRAWADGTVARSVAEYRNPPLPYTYTGETGAGVYRIQPTGGSAINVYSKMDYTGTSQPLVRLENQNGVRMWGDGTYASSAQKYRVPASGYVYAGETGDGKYRIQPKGSVASGVIDVMCDMTKNGGGWVMIFKNIWRADNALYYWADKDPRKYNVNNVDADMYSILYLMDDFKTAKGKYMFWLDYPELPARNIWHQSQNPETFDNTKIVWAPGYEAVDIQRTENCWGGLSKGTTTTCYLEGSFNSGTWYYTIGNYALWGTSMPGPSESVKEVYLWMKDE